MPFYSVNNHQFYNPFAMIVHAATHSPHEYPKFDLFETEFSQLNWSVEPEASFESLMQARALQLREKYDYLLFMFSGGTDSITMFNVFKRMNLHIDEIMISYHADPLVGHSMEAVHWLNANIYDPTTKITVLSRDGIPEFFSTLKEDFLADPEYLHWCHTCDTSGGLAHRLRHSDYLESKNSAIIVGLEKPLVMFKSGKWYMTHLDKTYRGFLKNVEYFFVSPEMPELHMKQCHMVKKYAKQFVNPTTDWSSSQFSDKSWRHFAEYSRWSGRDDNVVLVNAIHQKKHEADRPFNVRAMVDPTAVYQDPDLRLHDYNTMNFENQTVNRFLNGFKYFQTDRLILEYMERMNLLPKSKSIDNYHGIYSKFYDLGD